MRTINRPIYPLTIISDRYNGVYSGGRYLAFNLDFDEIPKEINASDMECCNFWDSHKDLLVGKGFYIDEAIRDLLIKMEEKNDD